MRGVALAHEQVAERYRAKIRKRRLRPGQRLPSIRDIALELSVSTRTAWLAVNLLRAEGWIEHSWGKQPVVLGEPGKHHVVAAKAAPLRKHPAPAPPAWPAGSELRVHAPGTPSEETWLAAHRRQVLAVADEALRYRELGDAAAVESLAEVERDVHAQRLTPGSFQTLRLCLIDLGFSPRVRKAATDDPVQLLLDRWGALLAEHPSQQS